MPDGPEGPKQAGGATGVAEGRRGAIRRCGSRPLCCADDTSLALCAGGTGRAGVLHGKTVAEDDGAWLHSLDTKSSNLSYLQKLNQLPFTCCPALDTTDVLPLHNAQAWRARHRFAEVRACIEDNTFGGWSCVQIGNN